MQESNFSQPSVALSRLMAEVQAMAQKHTKTDWGAAILNLPLMVVTYGLVELSTEDKSALARTPMPDAWVCAAAELPGASPKNLGRLLKVLDLRGRVSIEEADQFCAVELSREQEAARQRKSEQSRLAVQKSAGHEALTLRLASERFDPAPDDAYAKIRANLKDLFEASAGVASFAAEKAIWVGKGLGFAAQAMQQLRKSAGQ